MPEICPDILCTVEMTDGSLITADAPLAFLLQKERYTSYTQLALTAPVPMDAPIGATPRRIRFFINGQLLHEGLVEQVRFRRSAAADHILLNLHSKGLTSLLMQNELTPGLHPAVSVDRLMTEYYTFPPEIHWENDDDRSNYIFVREHSSLWDGLINLAYKRFRQYPFIRSSNTITLHPPEQPLLLTLGSHDLTAMQHRTIAAHLVSDLHMQDLNGSYDVYNASCEAAHALDIIRHKKLAFDRQYLNNPELSLQLRLAIAQQGWRSVQVRVPRYISCDLGDLLTVDGQFTGQRIAALQISGNASGITTDLSIYHDAFTLSY